MKIRFGLKDLFYWVIIISLLVGWRSTIYRMEQDMLKFEQERNKPSEKYKHLQQPFTPESLKETSSNAWDWLVEQGIIS